MDFEIALIQTVLMRIRLLIKTNQYQMSKRSKFYNLIFMNKHKASLLTLSFVLLFYLLFSLRPYSFASYFHRLCLRNAFAKSELKKSKTKKMALIMRLSLF